MDQFYYSTIVYLHGARNEGKSLASVPSAVDALASTT
jgi:hypothetical protein